MVGQPWLINMSDPKIAAMVKGSVSGAYYRGDRYILLEEKWDEDGKTDIRVYDLVTHKVGPVLTRKHQGNSDIHGRTFPIPLGI